MEDRCRAEFEEWLKTDREARGYEADLWNAWSAAYSGRSELLEALKELRRSINYRAACLTSGQGDLRYADQDMWSAMDAAAALIQKYEPPKEQA